MLQIPSLQFIFPEITLTAFALICLTLGAFGRMKNLPALLALGGIAVGFFLLPLSFEAGTSFSSGIFVNDAVSAFFRVVILAIGGLIVLFSLQDREGEEGDTGEYYFFILTVTLTMMLAVSTNNLMMIYIALESVSIISYLLAGYLKHDVFSSEAGMKYFVFGVLSTGITLYGISLIYGIFGTLDIASIFNGSAVSSAPEGIALFAFLLLLVGFGFKCSLVPFHMWTPDVYQGAPTPVAAFFSVGPKAMAFAFLLRVFLPGFMPMTPHWFSLAGIVAVLTMTIGNIVALKQNIVKRLLAYSTIAQAGYIFLGLAVGTVAGIKATLFYIFIYVLMNLGAFGAVIAASSSIKGETIEDYAGLYKKNPFTAIAFAISLLSLAGLPPLGGFLAKFFILAAAVKAQAFFFALILVFNSVIALYYYVNIIKFMFLHEPKDATAFSLKSPALQLALLVTVLGNLIFGLWPHPILLWLSSLL